VVQDVIKTPADLRGKNIGIQDGNLADKRALSLAAQGKLRARDLVTHRFKVVFVP
jgi:ABC-type nitrate/sulfonate/bicarbonate transport system substrate-binding protein